MESSRLKSMDLIAACDGWEIWAYLGLKTYCKKKEQSGDVILYGA